MVTINQSINVNGVSEIDGVNIAFMSANVPIDGKVSVNRQIQDKEAFEKNKEEIMKDFIAFDEYVYSLDSKDDTKQKDGGADAESTQ